VSGPFRLTEIGGDFRRMAVQQELFGARALDASTVREYFDSASTCCKVFKECTRLQRDWWKSVEFKVSVLSQQWEGTDWWVEPIRLTPKRPLPYEGQQFYTLRHISQSSESTLWIHAEGLKAHVQCGLDGALYTIYDGIKELFEEEEGKEGRNGSNEALNAIRVNECFLPSTGLPHVWVP
jgi:hypothetical protein